MSLYLFLFVPQEKLRLMLWEVLLTLLSLDCKKMCCRTPNQANTLENIQFPKDNNEYLYSGWQTIITLQIQTCGTKRKHPNQLEIIFCFVLAVASLWATWFSSCYMDFALCCRSVKLSPPSKTPAGPGEKDAQKRKHMMLSLCSKLKGVKQLQSAISLRLM